MSTQSVSHQVSSRLEAMPSNSHFGIREEAASMLRQKVKIELEEA